METLFDILAIIIFCIILILFVQYLFGIDDFYEISEISNIASEFVLQKIEGNKFVVLKSDTLDELFIGTILECEAFINLYKKTTIL
jgi:hypothetical protein